MASLMVQETLGQDTTDQLYTIEKSFKILEHFTKSLEKLEVQQTPNLKWEKLFDVSEDSELMKVIRKKRSLGKQIL